MTQHRLLPLLSALLTVGALLLAGCDTNRLGTLDPQGQAPHIVSAYLSPDSVNIDTLASTAGLFTVATTVRAHISDPDGAADVQSVSFQCLSPGGASMVASGNLSPRADTTGTLFMGAITFTVGRAEMGRYILRIDATDRQGHAANSLLLPFAIGRNNSPPFLGLPGLRILQSAGSDSILVETTVTVGDSQGIQTVRTVTARPMNTRDSTARQMFDDGNPVHGDRMAGDGVYSGRLWIQPTVTPQQVAFEFTATDASGAISLPVRRYFTNQAPHIVSLDVPTEITRPTSGSLNVTFHATVTDPDGRQDIDSVYFRNLSSTNPIPILMFDDGDLSAHGDAVAGDGIFSRTISIDASTTTGTKDFHFYAVDKAGARDEAVQPILIN